MSSEHKKGSVFVVSGPSGAGKSTLAKKAVEFFPDLTFSISYTTRKPRAGDVDGVDYHFVSAEEFDKMVESGAFLEYATVHGKSYGTSGVELSKVIDRGGNVILDIDVQGAALIRNALSTGEHGMDAVFIFVLPPSIEECRERLKKRANLSEDELSKRMKTAVEEIKRAEEYDFVIVNDGLNEAFCEFQAVIEGKKSETKEKWAGLKGRYGL
ncbi:MAG: guanylate kinase [Deltaproteobacteria bacterium]|nr:guanylate kinase [Deltaproteobacteria bacterium]